VPEEFRLWLLEWPAKVAIGFVWPVLPIDSVVGYEIKRLRAWNYLSVHPPQLYVIDFYTEPEERYTTAMLPIQTEAYGNSATFLVMDGRPSLGCLLVFSWTGEGVVFPAPKDSRIKVLDVELLLSSDSRQERKPDASIGQDEGRDESRVASTSRNGYEASISAIRDS
jgi:hypothetical protein